MQRTLTFIGFLALFAVGVWVLAGGVSAGAQTYQIPNNPIGAASVAGAILLIVVLTAVMGIGLAQAFGFLSKQITAPLNPDDRPEIEKRVVSAADRAGSGLGNVLRRVGYGRNEPITPYTPAYSYKPVPENVEARNFAIGLGLVMLGLLIYAAVTHWQSWMEGMQTLLFPLEPVPGVEVPTAAIGLGLVVILLGATAALGVGLSIWFYRTQQEKEKAAALKEPAWPAREIVTWEQQVRDAPGVFRRMRFLDKVLIALNAGLVLVLLGAVAIWVLPGISSVVAVDRASLATPTVVAEAPTPAPGGPPEDLVAEFEALPAGDATAGQAVFGSAAPPCSTCHKVNDPGVIIGPSLQGLGARAGTRRPDYPAELYIYESITRPNNYVVENFTPGVMPSNFKELLTPQQIADLMAYLQTLP